MSVSWSAIAEVYNPQRAGSIDGTDVDPHDRGIIRALKAKYKANKSVEGDPLKTVFIGRLNRETDEDTLWTAFRTFGKIKKCRLVKDIVTGFSKGYGFIEFEEEKSARNASKRGNKMVIDKAEVFVDMECERTLSGWIPRRMGGGIGGNKKSGQLRFGGKDRPFIKPLRPSGVKMQDEFGDSAKQEQTPERDAYRSSRGDRFSRRGNFNEGTRYREGDRNREDDRRRSRDDRRHGQDSRHRDDEYRSDRRDRRYRDRSRSPDRYRKRDNQDRGRDRESQYIDRERHRRKPSPNYTTEIDQESWKRIPNRGDKQDVGEKRQDKDNYGITPGRNGEMQLSNPRNNAEFNPDVEEGEYVEKEPETLIDNIVIKVEPGEYVEKERQTPIDKTVIMTEPGEYIEDE